MLAVMNGFRWLMTLLLSAAACSGPALGADNAKGKEPKAQPAATSPPFDPPLVRELCEHLKIQRDAENDRLLLSGSTTLTGKFDISDLKVTSRLGEKVILLKEIAAIQGGAGTGRRARLFLRDGSVLSGTMNWKKSSFEGSLGLLELKPESLDTVVLRTAATSTLGEGKFAAICRFADGDVRCLSAVPEETVRIRWSGGELQAPAREIRLMRQLPLPDLGREIMLKNGSRIHGWLGPLKEDSILASCTTYATSWNDFMADGGYIVPSPFTEGLCLFTADGSLLFGGWNSKHIAIASEAGIIEVPVAEIQRLRVQGQTQDHSPRIEIQTASGTLVKGSPLNGLLAWQYGEQVLNVPWPLVSEVIVSSSAAAK